jgi:hypothetical protein
MVIEAVITAIWLSSDNCSIVDSTSLNRLAILPHPNRDKNYLFFVQDLYLRHPND